MSLETQLDFRPEEFEDFYESQIRKHALRLNTTLTLSFLKSTALCVVGIALILISDVKLNMVPPGILCFLLGCFFFYYTIKIKLAFRSSQKQSRKEMEEYIQKHHQTLTMGLKVDENRIEYFENGQLITTSYWSDLQNTDFNNDYFFIFFANPNQNIMIPKFAVGEEFYKQMLKLTREKMSRIGSAQTHG